MRFRRHVSSGRTRRGALYAAIIVALSVTGFALGGGFTIGLTSSGPQPPTTTAALGDTVTFVNQDTAPHVVVASSAGLTTPTLSSGATSAYVLTKSGRLAYRQIGDAKNYQGEIDVRRVGEVTLEAAGSKLVRFGASVVLAGHTSLPSFPVQIQQKPEGEAGWGEAAATLTPDAQGAFSLTVQPAKSGQYRANVLQGELVSKPVPIGVSPVMTLSASRASAQVGTPVRLAARAVPASAVTSISLTTYNRRKARWQKVAARATAKGMAEFVWRATPGRSLLRAVVAKANLEPGFAPSVSRVVRVLGFNVPTSVTLRPSSTSEPAGTSVVLTARVAPGRAAKSVTLLRYSARRGRWHKELVRPVSSGRASFRWRLDPGATRLRALLDKQDLRIGFASSSSAPVTLVGTTEPRAKKKRTKSR